MTNELKNLRLSAIINLTEIPKEVIKVVDGKAMINVSFFLKTDRETGAIRKDKQGRPMFTISCAPKKEDRKEGVNYYIGTMFAEEQQPQQATQERVENAPQASDDVIDNLPF